MPEALADGPSAFTCAIREPQPCDELTPQTTDARAIGNLRTRLDESSLKPTVDQCLAHLKLLEAFHQLREDVATTDGLFGIHNHFVDAICNDKATSERSELLRKIREKRWAVYVTKAQQRYQRWWLKADNKGLLIDTHVGPTSKSQAFPSHFERLAYSADDLPPLGQLSSYC